MANLKMISQQIAALTAASPIAGPARLIQNVLGGSAGPRSTWVGVVLDGGRGFYGIAQAATSTTRAVRDEALRSLDGVPVTVTATGIVMFKNSRIGQLVDYNNRPYNPRVTTNPVTGAIAPARFDGIALVGTNQNGEPFLTANGAKLINEFAETHGDVEAIGILLRFMDNAFGHDFRIDYEELSFEGVTANGVFFEEQFEMRLSGALSASAKKEDKQEEMRLVAAGDDYGIEG